MSSFLDHGTMYLSVKVWLCLVLFLIYHYTNHGIKFTVPGLLNVFCAQVYICVCVFVHVFVYICVHPQGY